MSNVALATLAIRLLGIYAWFQVVAVAPMLSYFFVGDSFREDQKGLWIAMVIIAFFALALWIALGFVLVLAAGRIAARIAPEEEPRPQTADPEGLQPVLFSVVGLVLVVHSVPSLIQYFVTLAFIDEPSARLDPPWISSVVLALEFLMGVALFLGARGLSRLWRRIGEMNRMP